MVEGAQIEGSYICVQQLVWLILTVVGRMDSFDQKAKNDIHFTFSGTAEKKVCPYFAGVTKVVFLFFFFFFTSLPCPAFVRYFRYIWIYFDVKVMYIKWNYAELLTGVTYDH